MTGRTDTDALIKVEGLHKSFGKLHVLKGIDQEIHKGEVVSVIGPSGGGKSTFLRCLNLLEKPDQGKVWFEGIDITGPAQAEDRHGLPAVQRLSPSHRDGEHDHRAGTGKGDEEAAG